ncbi:hypothetical protein chiPu_0024801, partial [Chiloscyllium punctatum]|nr:hypothetical protein [Chiloscyllium punctatum]
MSAGRRQADTEEGLEVDGTLGSLDQPVAAPSDLGRTAEGGQSAARNLPSGCALLLSPEYARLQALHRQMAVIQQAVTGLVSQHQRRLARQEETQEGGLHLDQEAEPEPTEGPTPNHHGSEPPLSKETSSMTTLMGQLRDITQQQSELPETVK